jgi:hypothetical protein
MHWRFASASRCKRCAATSKLLSEAGLLARFHGGARVPGSTTENIAYRQRQQMQPGRQARNRAAGRAGGARRAAR